jgi:hypothetical protein
MKLDIVDLEGKPQSLLPRFQALVSGSFPDNRPRGFLRSEGMLV